MTFLAGAVSYPVIKVSGKNEKVTIEEPIVEEVPFTIFLNGQELITALASAGEEEFLAAGFLASEGIIGQAGDIKSIEVCHVDGSITVTTHDGKTAPEKMFLKRYLNTWRGKGRDAFNSEGGTPVRKVTGSATLTPESAMKYSQMLEDESRLFQATGGVHGGALALDGQFVCLSFDVGRHNVFDKLYGRCLIQGISTRDKIMVFSGRVSSEILLKLSRMNISIIIARSAPTSLALNMAEELGVTVIAFARDDRFNVYTHPHRIIMR